MENASAGCRAVELFDEEMGMAFPMLVLYPSTSPEKEEPLGPYTLRVAMDGQWAQGAFPLVVISHGSGGSHLVYRELAAHLARHGFVVAMPEHPKNNRNNNELARTAENLRNRPRHLRIAMDEMFGNEFFGPQLQLEMVAIVGHSLGGYTALAMAGGRPTALPQETRNLRAQKVDVTPDGRVKALVLLAPATVWFSAPEALREVRVPILMITGGRDTHAPAFHGQIVKLGVASSEAVEHKAVPEAGHFAFLTPFPPEMVKPNFLPSQDPPGFDRTAFQEELKGDVLAFLKRVLQQ